MPPKAASPNFCEYGIMNASWQSRWRTKTRRSLRALERVTLRAEAFLAHAAGDPRFNPLYHTGTLAVFLLLILVLTGIYLLMFYQFGFQDSYNAVAATQRNVIGHVMRALHRYASAALTVTILIHAWRTFVQDRFRGARWLAWASGILLTLVVWFIGITGYWLIWDERVHLLNQSLADLFEGWRGGQRFLVQFVVGKAAASGWQFMFTLFAIHFVLSVLVFFGLLYLHFRRLSRAKWMPPSYWSLGGLAVLVLLAIVFPLEMLPAWDPAQWPLRLPLDLFYLGYLPVALDVPPLLFWGGITALLSLVAALPFFFKRDLPKPVELDLAKCDGCTLCSRDCPYNAITMVERTDGAPHKFQAQINSDLCVSCGICVGSCPEGALTLEGFAPHRPPGADSLWVESPAPKVVFACERHTLQEDSETIGKLVSPEGGPVSVIPLTCLGMAHPDLAVQSFEHGASEVHFVGCPAEDCANREGNLWLEQRVKRERLPRLPVPWKDAPIFTHYLPPLAPRSENAPPTAYTLSWQNVNWRRFAPGLVLLLGILLAQIPLTRFSVPILAAQRSAWVQVTMSHRSGYPVEGAVSPLPPAPGEAPIILELQADDETLWEKRYEGGEAHIFGQGILPPGEHHVRLLLRDRPEADAVETLFDDVVTLAAGQVLKLDYRDASLGSDPEAGKRMFYENSLGTNAGCRICHSLEPGKRLVGPSLAGVATRAATRVPGMSAEEYLRQSILEPDAYVVEGYPAGQMVPNLGEVLTDEQVNDLVAFLMTLK